jgi:hypothetical protein
MYRVVFNEPVGVKSVSACAGAAFKTLTITAGRMSLVRRLLYPCIKVILLTNLTGKAGAELSRSEDVQTVTALHGL